MSQIEIAIANLDKTPIWNLPGTKFFLSFESPGPIEVELDNLTNEQKRTIAQDISRKVLIGKNAEELLTPANIVNSTKPLQGGGSLAKSYVQLHRDKEEGYVVAQKVELEQPAIEVVLDMVEERKNILKSILDQHVATVKKDLPGKTLSELRILKELEKDSKNRPSVIKLIDVLISKAQADVFHSLQKSFDPKGTSPSVKDLPSQYLDNVTPVIDSEGKEVTIRLGTDEE